MKLSIVTVTAGTSSASALLLLRVALDKPTNRADYPAAGVVVVGGSPVPYSGRLDYLCNTLADALALVGVYEAATDAAPAKITGHDATLDGWAHLLAGDVSVTQEATLNGVPALWLVGVPVRWVAR